MRAFVLLPVMLLLATAPAGAAVIVMHSDSGRDCYLQTLLEPTPSNNQRALATCGAALALPSDDSYNRAATLVNRADILLRLQDFRAVVADSDAAIALEPDVAVAYLNRGAGLVGLQRYREALEALDKSIALGVGDPQFAYFNRGLAKESLGDLLGAYHDYKMAVEIDPKFVGAAQELSRFQVTNTP